jgi:GNAT superfamily N-acetyltransferase
VREVGETVVKVDAVMVTEQDRRMGLGKALMHAVEEWGGQGGTPQAVLIPYAHSPSSMPFYRDGMAYRANTIGFRKPL